MYGTSTKLGRGGGAVGSRGGPGAAGKRNNSTFHHPPPLHRPSAPTSGGRLSIGGSAGPRNRNTVSAPTTATAPSSSEETFNLVTGTLNFAMIIRLAPDLVDEIKRVEAQGGTARIKFDPNANNPSGNVIDVGGKDFRFTWSREMGDLCDIYEERQSGEDGNGLLVESGGAWRKLNVQRVLDESTKNHVKMRSEEAERKLKSRKAIILDHGNPSMKNQMKALAAAETNPWRKPFKQKKEPEFKKRKIETPPVAVGGPPKSAYKSGFPSTTPAKGRPSVSPLHSPPERFGTPASPFETGNSKAHTSIEDIIPIQTKSKESDKETLNKVTGGAVREKTVQKGNFEAKPLDMQSKLISLLMEKPEGMSLKALEKAIGDTVPNSATRKIEPIIKKIATFQAPGRYFLKPGVELENFKKPLSENGSSPEDNHHQTTAPEDKRGDVPASPPNFAGKAATKELDKQAQLNTNIGEELNSSKKIDIQHHSPDLFGDKKVSDNSEGPAGSSSDSGSDSDSESDSSDSGSDSGSHSRSRSRSKSRSPMRSGSGSSSDSESDASSNSKQGSDEDVDIMTSDDDKESKPNLQTSEPRFSASPIPWTSDGGPVQNGLDEKQDGNGSDVVEIEKDLPDDDREAEMAVVANSISNKEVEKPLEDIRLSSPGHQECQESQVYTGKLFSERENIAKDGFKHEQTDSSGRIVKSKSKRGSDSKYLQSEHAKRLKPGSLPQPQMSRGGDSLFSENSDKLSPDRVVEDPYKGHSTPMMNRASRDRNVDSGLQKGYNQGIPGKSILDTQNSGRKPIDLNVGVKAPDTAERPGIHSESLGRGIKYSQRNFHLHEGLPVPKDKVSKDMQDEDCSTKEKNLPRNSKEGAFGDKLSTRMDSYYYGKHIELGGKFKDAGEECSPKDNDRIGLERSPVRNGRGKLLQRELSDLELGELREPLPEETPGLKKDFQRKSSFKQLENKPSTSDYWNSDINKGKPTGRTTTDSVKLSPPQLRVGFPSNPEGSSKRTPEGPERHAEDTRTNQRVVQSQPQGPQHRSRVDRPELSAQKLTDVSGKPRHNEARASQGAGVEGYGDIHKKASVIAPEQHDSNRGPISHPVKESKTQKSNTLTDVSDIQKDTSLSESNEGGLKRRESSSDENSSYSKYEKEEPELKGPIKDFSQYKEYVQEYHEKYDSYCSLDKALESYRNEFQKLGRDLEIAKPRDKDKYFNILGHLKELYRQCGPRHKRLKKIFIVLHEELKHLKQMIEDYVVSYRRD